MPLVLAGTATTLALSSACLKAATLLMSGLRVPERTAAPRAARARSTSVPTAIRPAAISSLRPSLERIATSAATPRRSEEHTSELQSRLHLVCRLLLEKKKKQITRHYNRKIRVSLIHQSHSHC